MPPSQSDHKTSAKKYFQREEFLGSFIVQKLLLVLAPFVLSPDFKHKDSTLEKVIGGLKLQLLAPILGSSFFTGALYVSLYILRKYALDVSWLFQFDSIMALSHLTIMIALFAYAGALARFVSPYCLKILNYEKLPLFPFSFWTARYGGLLMFLGFVNWGFTFIIWLHLGPIMFIIISLLFLSLLFMAYLEIRQRYYELYEGFENALLKRLTVLEFIFFSTLIMLFGLCYYHFRSLLL